MRSATGSSTRSSATSSTRSIPITRAAGESTSSAPCRRGSSRGSSRSPRCSGSASCSERGCAREPGLDGAHRGAEIVSRARNAIVSALVLLVGRGRRRPDQEATRIVPEPPRNVAAELAVLGLLGLSSLSALGFILVYAFAGSLPAVTQLLGLSLGLALLFLATALVVVGLKLVPTEEVAEEYPPHEHPHEQQVIAELVDESGTRFTRGRLFKLGLLGAGGTLGLALLAPTVSFGPLFRVGDFLRTPWRRGRR